MTLEGPEGSGKTTLGRGLKAHFESMGREVVLTREPGAAVGGAIRNILLHGENLDPKCELFLFLSDRSQHVAKLIRPALASGKVVICDRFADSTLVYQGYGRGLDLDLLRQWNAFATGGLIPDRTLLLDLPAETGLARLQNPDRIDAEPLAFHQSVREGFLREASEDPFRWRVLDATLPPEAVLEAAIAALSDGT